MLWAFDFFEPLDPKTGLVVPLDINNYSLGVSLEPRPFSVRMVPRSPKHAASVARGLAEAKSFLASWD